MNLNRTWLTVAGGLALAGIFALTLTAFLPRVAAAHGGPARIGAHAGPGGGEALADALGITPEALETAKQAARDAVLTEAIADGTITEEQAERFEDFGPCGAKLLGPAAADIDRDALLAEALGISVEALETARDTAFETQLDAALENGRIDEAQAERMRTRRALGEYLQQQGAAERMRSVQEDLLDQAVADGVITEEQAEELQNARPFGHRFGGPRMQHRMPNHLPNRGFMRPAPAPDAEGTIGPARYFRFDL